MSETKTRRIRPPDYAFCADNKDTFTIRVGGSTLDLSPGDRVVLLDSTGREVDGGTIEKLVEGRGRPMEVAPPSSTLTIRR